MTLALRDDQVADLTRMIGDKKVLNLNEPGTGKTPPVCVNMKRRLDDGIRTIWSQPKSLMAKNKREIMRWTGLNDNDVAILDGTPAKIDKLMAKEPGIILCGPDRLKRMINDIPPSFGAHDVDEFHMCYGGAASGRTGAYLELNKRMEEGVAMTGTLINGRLDTAFPAIHAIEPRYYPFGYDQFLGAHAYLDDYGRPYAWHSHERLGLILGQHGFRRTFESIFGHQEVVRETQWVEMTPKQREMFDKFRNEAFLELERFMIDGTLPGVAFMRARQIMEHPNAFPDLTNPGGPPVDIMPGARPAKLDALEIHFEDHIRTGKPLIVFAALVPQTYQIADLARGMGLRAGVINGEVSTKVRNQVDVGFISGELDLVVATPATASVGYNWQFWGPAKVEVDHVIFASLGFMDSDYIQGYRRAIRQKRSTPLRVTTMGYLDSADLRLMQILESKSRDANRVDPTREVLRFNDHTEEEMT